MFDWSIALHFLGVWLRRLRWLGAALVFALGFAVTALERWRPELIEPRRTAAARLVGDYIGPISEQTTRLRRHAIKTRRLWDVETEKESLEREVMRLEAELQATQEQVRRLSRVSGLKEWRAPDDLEFIAADVIGFTTDDQSAVFTINRGRVDGISEGLPVVGRRGLAGVVREVSARTARVQALTDPLSAVGVADLESRKRGVALGRGRETPPEFIPENEVQPIEPGSVLITSGFGDSIYPKGLVVGRLTERRTNMRGLVYGVIELAEDFSALEEALVIRPADRGGLAAMGSHTVEMPTRGMDEPTTPTWGMDPATSGTLPLLAPTTGTLTGAAAGEIGTGGGF